MISAWCRPQIPCWMFCSRPGKSTIGVGKIHDIFAGKGVSETIRTSGNTEGLKVTMELADRDFDGLAL
mgnify:CR=1 FL=1